MKSTRRPTGQRCAVVIRGRIGSRTAPPGQVIGQGMGWSLEGVGGDLLRFRRGRDVIDLPIAEVVTGMARASVTEYDDDYGSPLVRTSASMADGSVVDTAEDGSVFYGNDRFTVHAFSYDTDLGLEGAVRLSVHDHHRNPDIAWRLLQRIKNEVCGPERWAAEWFPNEDRLVDEANERHLFVLPAGEAPPAWFAYHQPRVVADAAAAAAVGAVQAPLPAWYPEATS